MFTIIALLLALGAGAMSEDSARITLTGDLSPGEELKFAPGSFNLPLEEAYLAQGSFSGIWVKFSDQHDDADYHQLSLFIPSHGEFAVGYDSSKGEFCSSIPEVPFSFRAEESEVHDRRGRPRPLNIELAHWHRRAKDHLSKASIEFTDCEIVVQEMAIRDNTLSFSGTFECCSQESEHRASGSFSVHEAELSLSKVD